MYWLFVLFRIYNIYRDRETEVNKRNFSIGVVAAQRVRCETKIIAEKKTLKKETSFVPGRKRHLANCRFVDLRADEKASKIATFFFSLFTRIMTVNWSCQIYRISELWYISNGLCNCLLVRRFILLFSQSLCFLYSLLLYTQNVINWLNPGNGKCAIFKCWTLGLQEDSVPALESYPINPFVLDVNTR